MEHVLKIAPPWFAAVVAGAKTAEVRRDDRGYDVGDTLILREWDGSGETGRTCRVLVTHVLRSDDVPHLLPPGVAVLSVQRLDEAGAPVPRDPVAGETGAVLAALHEIRDAVVQHTTRLELWGHLAQGILRDQTRTLDQLAHDIARLDAGGGPRVGRDAAEARGTPLGPWWKRLW